MPDRGEGQPAAQASGRRSGQRRMHVESGGGRRRGVRLRDVAAAAGVDASTVSRVVRGDHAHRVGAETRRRILVVAARLGYRGDSTARALRTRRTEMIGLLMPDQGPFSFAEVAHGVRQVAREAGLWVLLVETEAELDMPAVGGASAEALHERLVREGRVDGLIVASAMLRDETVQGLAAYGVPLVLVNRTVPGVASVTVDDAGGARLGVEHLAALGHRRIAQVAFEPRTYVGRERDRGYREAMSSLQVPLDPAWVVSAGTADASGAEAAARLAHLPAARRPTAVFVASVLNVASVVRGLRANGLRVPDDVSVIFMPDHPLAADLGPPLTAVKMPLHRMGEQAARALVAAIHGQPIASARIEDAPWIVLRASTGPPHAAPTDRLGARS